MNVEHTTALLPPGWLRPEGPAAAPRLALAGRRRKGVHRAPRRRIWHLCGLAFTTALIAAGTSVAVSAPEPPPQLSYLTNHCPA
ncbi:hypothetical protein [Catellatospora sp. NPDC049133]|uniref:hypothetical protein n=1 Tax=Catellatospora sp. NPDC049133 TaxID=3155499 RepID=UPI003405B502